MLRSNSSGVNWTKKNRGRTSTFDISSIYLNIKREVFSFIKIRGKKR